MTQRPKYTIGKPGIDDGRTWEDISNTIQRAEVEKIELASGSPIPDHRKESATSNDESLEK